jgi:hypothetical protein
MRNFEVLDCRAESYDMAPTNPSKEVVLWTSITLKNPSFSAGFEPANLGSNGKHYNPQTTEGD